MAFPEPIKSIMTPLTPFLIMDIKDLTQRGLKPMSTVDILSKGDYPSSALSNFAPHAFFFCGAEFACMEALLQSLKFQDPEVQASLWQLNGKDAKAAGTGVDWQGSQTLWFKGRPMERSGQEYQSFLNEAFIAMFSCSADARAALSATGTAKLTHSIGVQDPAQTILTEDELCSRLTLIRSHLPAPAAVEKTLHAVPVYKN